ncbi:MAG: UDP-N-acetylmuramate dehydrogenase [Firmicutes bacterium]|nr:UDP-N-acetylmuramate dehydrogenase [Bacillota bacterium]
MKEIKAEILKINSDIEIIENAPMSKYTSFKAGGHAKALIDVTSVEDLKALLQLFHKKGVKHMILGNGSNTLFKDSGYDGIVLRNMINKEIEFGTDPAELALGEKCEVTVGGTGILLSTLARTVAAESLTGLEFASGIPGSLGGALFMNAGAYGGEMVQVVKTVRVISPDGMEDKIMSNEEMEMSYRHSILEENGYIAVEAVLELTKGDKEAIMAEMKELATKRNTKQPVTYPSAGSTFKRPEGHFAGKLVEDAGLKGVSVGGAEVSTLHSGFIINKGNATATDILELIALVQNRVYDEFGVELKPEVRIIG